MSSSSLSLSTLRCGLAGWSYPHWEQLVYPSPRPRSFHALQFLSRYFDVLEINTSFYQYLKPEITKLWAQKVSSNSRFRFTAKLHRDFTHDRRLNEHDVNAYSEGLRPLMNAKRLGCVLMQFPWSFRFTQENREYLIQLRRAFAGFPLVAEMRHASWMCEEALGTFVDYHIGFANIDQPQHVKAMPPTAFLTASVGYVRLHGRNHENWWKGYAQPGERPHRYDYLYSEGELSEWTERIKKITSFASDVYVIANNDAGGKSVVNAIQLMSMLEERTKAVPQEWHNHFGDLLHGYVDRPRQEMLFDMARATNAPQRAVA